MGEFLPRVVLSDLVWTGVRRNGIDEWMQLQVLKVDLQDGVYAVHWKNVRVVVYLPTAGKVHVLE